MSLVPIPSRHTRVPSAPSPESHRRLEQPLDRVPSSILRATSFSSPSVARVRRSSDAPPPLRPFSRRAPYLHLSFIVILISTSRKWSPNVVCPRGRTLFSSPQTPQPVRTRRAAHCIASHRIHQASTNNSSKAEILVERRRLGQTNLAVKPGIAGITNATKPENMGTFDYAHLRVPLPKDLTGSGIFTLNRTSVFPESYFLMVRR